MLILEQWNIFWIFNSFWLTDLFQSSVLAGLENSQMLNTQVMMDGPRYEGNGVVF